MKISNNEKIIIIEIMDKFNLEENIKITTTNKTFNNSNHNFKGEIEQRIIFDITHLKIEQDGKPYKFYDELPGSGGNTIKVLTKTFDTSIMDFSYISKTSEYNNDLMVDSILSKDEYNQKEDILNILKFIELQNKKQDNSLNKKEELELKDILKVFTSIKKDNDFEKMLDNALSIVHKTSTFIKNTFDKLTPTIEEKTNEIEVKKTLETPKL
jgi:hypothetical protein